MESAGPHRDPASGRPTGAASARPDTPQRPLVDLTAHTKAAQAIADRSRSEGVWSLGHLRICWLALGIGGGLLAVAGGFLGGLGAVLGVVLGTVIVGAFFTFSAVVIAWVEDQPEDGDGRRAGAVPAEVGQRKFGKPAQPQGTSVVSPM